MSNTSSKTSSKPPWTRKLELELIMFIRTREAVWKPAGNTNHDIHLKYKAYAEFASKLGKGFTASSVRDRWVNIRSTFHHNLRKVKRTEESGSGRVYVPCWPLWKPLQFLRHNGLKAEVETELNDPEYPYLHSQQINEEAELKLTPNQLNKRTDRPRNVKIFHIPKNSSQCVKVINDLIDALNPLMNISSRPSYWYFGKHVVERLECMRDEDAHSASQEIMRLVNSCMQSMQNDVT